MLSRLDNLAWLAYDLGADNARVVTGCRLSPWTGNLALAPKTWTFQGSDNGADWTQLDSQSNVTNWTAAYNEYHFANAAAYRHYRLRITANNNNNAGCVCVAEMDLEGPLVGPEFRYDLEVTHQAGTTGRAARHLGRGPLILAMGAPRCRAAPAASRVVTLLNLRC
jgi:hypothetical protein